MAIASLVISIVAVLFTALTYVDKVRQRAIRLELTCTPNPHDRPDRYVVTVTNVGSVPAPIGEAGVIDDVGKKHVAVEPVQAGDMARWLPAFCMTLAPHASKRASVPVRANEPKFRVALVYAVRQDGRETRMRVASDMSRSLVP